MDFQLPMIVLQSVKCHQHYVQPLKKSTFNLPWITNVTVENIKPFTHIKSMTSMKLWEEKNINPWVGTGVTIIVLLQTICTSTIVIFDKAYNNTDSFNVVIKNPLFLVGWLACFYLIYANINITTIYVRYFLSSGPVVTNPWAVDQLWSMGHWVLVRIA